MFDHITKRKTFYSKVIFKIITNNYVNLTLFILQAMTMGYPEVIAYIICYICLI